MKRVLIFLCFTAVLMSLFTLNVFADTVDEGTVNSAALNYFTGVVNKLPANSHYVIYRTGDYTTSMVYGFDLVLSGSNISSASSCTQLIYNTRGAGSTTSYTPTLSTSELSSFQLSTSDTSIIYSSLGSWSTVGDTSKDTFSYILWSIVFLIFIYIVFKHFRYRRYYINL